MDRDRDLEHRLARLERFAERADHLHGEQATALKVIEESLRYRSQVAERVAEEVEDHERRLRALERVAWALAGTAGASMVTAIISLVVGRHP